MTTLRESIINPIGIDTVGTHISLAETAKGFSVVWLDCDGRARALYPTKADAEAAYENAVRRYSQRRFGQDNSGRPIWDETDVDGFLTTDCVLGAPAGPSAAHPL